jgi:hypothetical protein
VGVAPVLDDVTPLEEVEMVCVTVFMFLVPVDVVVEVGRRVLVREAGGSKLREEDVVESV